MISSSKIFMYERHSKLYHVFMKKRSSFSKALTLIEIQAVLPHSHNQNESVEMRMKITNAKKSKCSLNDPRLCSGKMRVATSEFDCLPSDLDRLSLSLIQWFNLNALSLTAVPPVIITRSVDRILSMNSLSATCVVEVGGYKFQSKLVTMISWKWMVKEMKLRIIQFFS